MLRPKQDAVEKVPPMAQDDHEEVIEAGNDNDATGRMREVPHEPKELNETEQAPEKLEDEAGEEQLASGPVRDIVDEIERVKPGSIVFMRGLTAKRSESDARDLSETRFGAKGYVAGVEKWRQKNKRDDIVVVSGDELKREGAGAHGEAAESVIKKIAQKEENHGKTIVVDYEPELENILFKPWEKLGGSMREVMSMKGASGENWLRDWFARQSAEKKEEPEEEKEPTSSEVLEAYFEAVEDLRAFKHKNLGERDFSLILDGDNPLEMMFLTYCATGRVDPAAVQETIARAKNETNRIISVRFEGETQVTTSLGMNERTARRAA